MTSMPNGTPALISPSVASSTPHLPVHLAVSYFLGVLLLDGHLLLLALELELDLHMQNVLVCLMDLQQIYPYLRSLKLLLRMCRILSRSYNGSWSLVPGQW
uniref:Uncharacterized protein n=1 Tax=Glycine max TaxID=3847 RepID=C6TFD3_SOYBN|nr:unknown [Glycine max]